MINLRDSPETAAPAAHRNRLVAWLVPDLAMTFALATLLSLFLLLGGATGLFADSDTGWHIRIGERMISTGMLPHTDPFSFSKPGEPWIAWEWGADVLMGAAYRVSGLAGVALLYGLSIGASVWMWFRLSRAAGGAFLLTGLFLAPMLPTTTLHWLARPHIFGWLFMLGTVWVCERMPAPLRLRHLALTAILAAVWTNLHASFFFAPMVLLCYAAGDYLRPLIWETHQPSRVRAYLWLALAALMGTAANPNGWRLHQHVIQYLFNSKLLDQITEFQSFNFHSDGAIQVMATLAICIGGSFAALAIQKPERFLLSMLLTAAALHSVRALPVAALLLLPLANGSITVALSRARNLTAEFRRRLAAAIEYGDHLHTIQMRFHGFALVPLAAVLLLASIRARAGFPVNELPVTASAQVASLPAVARILSTDAFGGYLIYRFNGERKVFFDGRSDFYGAEFMERYLRLIQGRPGWKSEFNRWNFTHALLPPECPLILLLEANGWHETYHDRTAILLAGASRL